MATAVPAATAAHRIFHGLLLQPVDPTLSLVVHITGDFRFDVLRRHDLTNILGRIRNPLPQTVDRRRQLRPVALGLAPQFLHG